MNLDETKKYDYKNVFIVPQYSDITSRTQVDTSFTIDEFFKLDVPVISANMDTVTDGEMANSMSAAGGCGAIHRFMTIQENVQEFQKTAHAKTKCFVSIGVNSDSKERAQALYEAGARYFIIDIAHGHSKMMIDMIKWLRGFSNVMIMAGNVATFEGALDLFSAGADAVKIGIGPGAVCTTKNVTGVTVPQWSAVAEVCSHKNRAKYKTVSRNGNPILVADGGITEIGDIAKALGAGADLIMSGRLFTACKEAPGPRINGKKVYRGMASRDAMLTIKDASVLPTPEGISTVLDESGETVEEVVKHIKGGLQSALSYSNARNLKHFKELVRFGVRA